MTLLLVSVSLLAACGATPKTTTPASTTTTGQGSQSGTQAQTPSQPEANKNPMDELYEAAKKEGSLVWYTHLAAIEPVQMIVDDFNKRYPGIKVEVTQKTGAAILQQFENEKKGNLHIVDVFQYPGTAPIEDNLIPKGWVEKYEPLEASKYPADTVIKEYAYPWFAYTIGVAYNPQKVTPEEVQLLKTYDGWADPRFKGRVNIVAPTGGSTSRWIYTLWKDPKYGPAWFKKIAALEPAIFTSVTPAAERMVAGEFDISFNQIEATAGRLVSQGSPIHFTYAEYTVTTPALMLIANKAPHPNAAKLFVNWILSDEGQRSAQKHAVTFSLRQGLTELPIQAPWYQLPAKSVSPQESTIQLDMKEVVSKWSTLFKWAGR